MKSANFFCLFYTVQRGDAHCSQIKPQLKVEIEEVREAPSEPSIYNCDFLEFKSLRQT